MLNELSPKMQRAWLAKSVGSMHMSDQMHLPAPQALLEKWTLAACNDNTTDADHAYNLARYWFHGVRFPAHSAAARVHLKTLLSKEYMAQHTLRAAETMLAAEVLPIRIVRLWGFAQAVLPDTVFVPHLERLLAEPLPTGKRLKLSQIQPEYWSAWLGMQEKLTPLAFKTGLELHIRANLVSRQDADPFQRSAAAWIMLRDCETALPVLDKTIEVACLNLPSILSVLVQYADSQTLRHFPWPAVQEHFSSQPHALKALWLYLFNTHKNVLLGILSDIDELFHPYLLQLFRDLPEFAFEETHCASMMNLVKRFPAWSVLLNKMLAYKSGFRKLGSYLLGSSNPQSGPRMELMPGDYFTELTAQQWRYMLMPEDRPAYNAQQLANIWELVRVHKLHTLAACPWLQRATMQAIPVSVARLNKVSAWDVSLGLPSFYATLMQVHLKENEQEHWFNDWMEKPSAEKMIVQAFQWFNPTIEVPPMRELQLLAQAISDKATIVDVLSHLSRKMETLELPNLLD